MSGTERTLSPWSGHLPPVPLLHEVGGLEAEAQSEDAVACGGRAAALDVAEHRRARLHARALLDLLRNRFADGAVLDAHVAELVDLAFVGDAGQLGALARDDHREVLAASLAPLDGSGDRVVVDRLLGDEDVVGAARDPREQRDPAGVAPHRLDDDDPAVRLRGRVHAIDRLGCNVDGVSKPKV